MCSEQHQDFVTCNFRWAGNSQPMHAFRKTRNQNSFWKYKSDFERANFEKNPPQRSIATPISGTAHATAPAETRTNREFREGGLSSIEFRIRNGGRNNIVEMETRRVNHRQ